MSETVTIATRKSPLALRQTELVREWLRRRRPEMVCEELPLSTKVDERLNWSLEQRGGIGLFTKELEDALLDRRADIAVHSAKDLPTRFENGLVIAGYLPRARAHDVLVHREDRPQPETIATGSPRRRAQVALLHPRAAWTTIRGNVGSRMEKIVKGEADATLLAAAGLDRLGIDHHEGLNFVHLSIDEVVPAPGQAAIAIQCRAEDQDRFEDLFCPETRLAVELERAFLRRLGGGCQTPVGAHYAEGSLRVFHPETGHRRFEIDLRSAEAIEPNITEILKALSLKP